MAPFYYKGYELINNREAIRDSVKRIAADNGVPFLDYVHDSLSYDCNNFYNATHLSKNATEKYATKLALELKNYMK